MDRSGTGVQIALLSAVGALTLIAPGCRTATRHRHQADKVAYDIIQDVQGQALDKTEPFSIESPADTLRRRLMIDQELPHSAPVSLGSRRITPIEQWPDEDYLVPPEADTAGERPAAVGPVILTLFDTLQIAALNSRDYQSQKEQVFRAALRLDLQRDAFRATWAGVIDTIYQVDLRQDVVIDSKGNTKTEPIGGSINTDTLDLTQRFKNGMAFTAAIGVDLVQLLTQHRVSSRGLFADASISIPLLRGAGRFVVTEPLTQAERDVVYAVYDFERFKRQFAVRIATDYLAVLQQLDEVDNAEENYRQLVRSTRRSTRLAQAGRLPEIQVDQVKQDELRARDRWVSARETYDRRLDAFKVTLGLPTDAGVELEREELIRLADAAKVLLQERTALEGQPDEPLPADAPVELMEPSREGAGRYEFDEAQALDLAFQHRLDLRIALGRIFDSQRTVAVAADQLVRDLTLLGSGATGARRTLASAASEDARLRPNAGSYSVLLGLDLPLERTSERNVYRNSLIDLEASVRDLQALEDEIKLEIRNALRGLLVSREGLVIQAEAVEVARRRVESTQMFLEAGRAETRDVLEAQEALVSAQNALTDALVRYRVGELNLQRDLGLLEVNEMGVWREYSP